MFDCVIDRRNTKLMMRWEGWIVATAITYIVLDSGSCGKMLVLSAKLRLRLTTERGTPFMPFFSGFNSILNS